MWISPDHTWTWKDQDDYDTAIAEGLVDASTRRHFEREADQILAELRSGKDPFSEEFSTFTRTLSGPCLCCRSVMPGTAALGPFQLADARRQSRID